MLSLSYEYKLRPTAEQGRKIDRWLDICRQVYNFALAERKDWVRSRKCQVDCCSLQREYVLPADAKRPTYYSQCKSLAAAKKSIEHLKEPHTHVLQQALRQLEAAFVAMWERGHGFPRFKKRMRSFLLPQLNKVVVENDCVNLPKLGRIRMRQSRPLPEGFEVKQARVVRRASGYYVVLVLQSDGEIPEIQPNGYPLGIDLGIESYLATSDGQLVANPKFFLSGQRKLKSLQRQLKRKTKGSSRWHKAQQQVARYHEYLSNARKDFQFKLAHQLCDRAGSVYAEDLNLKGLVRGMLGKHCLDAAWGQFLSILSHVAFKRGVYFEKVEAHGTSQTCPQCQVVVKKDLSVRVHECPECGYTANRDVAAAQVVVQRGCASAGRVEKKLTEGKTIGFPMK
ncbi:MAG: transposase [Cyanobacteria bacterium J06648_11]